VIDPKLKNWILITVTAVWALNFLVGLVPPLNYKPDQAINAIFMATVGGLLAVPALRKKGGDKEIEKKEDKDGDAP
jgi:hypothetical protein